MNTSDFYKKEAQESLDGKLGCKQSKSRDQEDVKYTILLFFIIMSWVILKYMRDTCVSNTTGSPWSTIIWEGNGICATRSIS